MNFITVPFLFAGLIAKIANKRVTRKAERTTVQTNHETKLATQRSLESAVTNTHGSKWSTEPNGIFEHLQQTTGIQR